MVKIRLEAGQVVVVLRLVRLVVLALAPGMPNDERPIKHPVKLSSRDPPIIAPHRTHNRPILQPARI